MDDYIEIKRDERQIAREREKARQLRKSAWWQAQLDRGVCHYCGRKFTREELTMDHVVPVVRGGKSNLILLDCFKYIQRFVRRYIIGHGSIKNYFATPFFIQPQHQAADHIKIPLFPKTGNFQ